MRILARLTPLLAVNILLLSGTCLGFTTNGNYRVNQETSLTNACKETSSSLIRRRGASRFSHCHLPLHILHAKPPKDDDDDLVSGIIGSINLTLQAMSRPSVGGVALGIPLTLLLVVAISPLGQGLLTVLIFIGLDVLGRTVVLGVGVDSDTADDDDAVATTSKLDLFALLAAILTATLLAPSNGNNNLLSTTPITTLEGVGVIVVIGSFFAVSAAVASNDQDQQERQQELKQWDWDFFDKLNNSDKSTQQQQRRREGTRKSDEEGGAEE